MTDLIWTDTAELDIIKEAESLPALRVGGETKEVKLLLMNEFPGIGGPIETFQSIPAVYRVESSSTGETGHRRYLMHGILKKLDDYFFKTGHYKYAHIARPLGSTSEGYIYEYVFGSEGFSWYVSMMGEYKVDRVPVDLADWNLFTELYRNAGINMVKDITDPDAAYLSKNIIHAFSRIDESGSNPRLNSIWRRIDFGSTSIDIDYAKFRNYLSDNEASIRDTLDTKSRRYDMLWLASCYLEDRNCVTDRDIGRLVELTYNFRNSTLTHLNKRGGEAD